MKVRHGRRVDPIRSIAVAAFVVVAAAPAFSQTQPVYRANRRPTAGVEISYALTIDDPNRHLYGVELRVSGIRDGAVRVSMPAWAPGAYRISDYARNVQAFAAYAGSDDRTLDWEKISKDTWEIEKPPSDDLVVRYQVYSQNLTSDFADLAGPATYMYVEDHKHVPVSVEYTTPPGWEVYTGLSGEEGRFVAPDYDVFIDAPAFVGRARVLEFFYENERYRLVFSDPDIEFDEDQVITDVRAIVASTLDIFGSTPFDDYTFLFRVNEGSGSGGLEHLNSTRITVGRENLTDRESYERFLYVVAHEFFHVWNVKWIRPEGLGPFDYGREVHTRLLWVSEGVTSYYGRLLLARAGILTEDEYLESLARQIGAFQQNPGRFLMSNEEASWNTWLTSDNAANNSISYYTKGEIAALLLDLEIRGRTDNARSLDDVMRYLMANWAEQGAAIPEDGFLTAIEAVSGTEFDDMYRELATSRGEPDYGPALAHAGLGVSSERESTSLYMGVRVEATRNGSPRILSVVDRSPAQRAGLDRGDVLLSFDGRPVTMDTLTPELNTYSFGDSVHLVFRRGSREMEIEFAPEQNREEQWSIERLRDSTPRQQNIRETWLGE